MVFWRNMMKNVNTNENRHLLISGILFTIILLLWPIFMALSSVAGSLDDQIRQIASNGNMYKISFFFAFLIAPSIVYLIVSILSRFYKGNNVGKQVGYLFLAVYMVLVSMAYASQFILVPLFLSANLLADAKIWHFHTVLPSISYFLDQTGYFFFGISTIALFYNFIYQKGLKFWLGALFLLSGILSIAAFIGLIISNQTINSLTVPSGLFLIPVGIISIILGLKKGNPQT